MLLNKTPMDGLNESLILQDHVEWIKSVSASNDGLNEILAAQDHMEYIKSFSKTYW